MLRFSSAEIIKNKSFLDVQDNSKQGCPGRVWGVEDIVQQPMVTSILKGMRWTSWNYLSWWRNQLYWPVEKLSLFICKVILSVKPTHSIQCDFIQFNITCSFAWNLKFCVFSLYWLLQIEARVEALSFVDLLLWSPSEFCWYFLSHLFTHLTSCLKWSPVFLSLQAQIICQPNPLSCSH